MSRVALITGGGRGLGRIMALALLEAGHRVVLSSTDRASLESVATESGAGPDRIALLVEDLAVSGGAERLADAASHVLVVRLDALQRRIDELSDSYHANADLLVLHERMLVAVDTHDDHAVIAQLVDVEIVAADAAAERSDQRADFGR